MEIKRELKDSGLKIIFDEHYLLAEFLRDYVNNELFQNITPEDIEDQTARFVRLDLEEQEADTVKKITIPEWGEVYAIALTEHESQVNHRMSMKLLQYMAHIWTIYEKECERANTGSTREVGFRYPPIIPIVYYNGHGNWTAEMDLRKKVWGGEQVERYIPKFEYEIITLSGLSEEEIISHKNAMSVAMLADKMQKPEDSKRIREKYESILEDIDKEIPEQVRKVLAEIIIMFQRKIKVAEEEIARNAEVLYQRRLTEMFATLEEYNMQETREIAKREGRLEGRLEGHREGHREGRLEERAVWQELVADKDAEIERLRAMLEKLNGEIE